MRAFWLFVGFISIACGDKDDSGAAVDEADADTDTDADTDADTNTPSAESASYTGDWSFNPQFATVTDLGEDDYSVLQVVVSEYEIGCDEYGKKSGLYIHPEKKYPYRVGVVMYTHFAKGNDATGWTGEYVPSDTARDECGYDDKKAGHWLEQCANARVVYEMVANNYLEVDTKKETRKREREIEDATAGGITSEPLGWFVGSFESPIGSVEFTARDCGLRPKGD